MEDLVKKAFYTGVGAMTTITEKVKTTVDEWVEKGKMTEEEGKKVVEDLMQDTETKKDEYEGKVKSFIDKLVEKFNLPTHEEVGNLKERIAQLEAKLAEAKSNVVEKVKEEAAEIKDEAKEVVSEAKKAAPKRRTTRKKTTTKKEE